MSHDMTVIVDVDNTLVDQVPRKKAIFEHLQLRAPADDDLRQDFFLRKALPSGTDRPAFMRELFGAGFQDRLAAIPGAVDALNDISKRHRILYLTGRPGSQEAATVELLKKLGFPVPDGDHVKISLWPAEREVGTYEEQQVLQLSADWKRDFVSRYVSQHEVLGAVSDDPKDIVMFASLGIPSILFVSHGTEADLRNEVGRGIGNQFVSNSVRYTRDWKDVQRVVTTLEQAKRELTSLAHTHSQEYARFLGDLDAKARMLLIIGTFLGAAFFGMSWRAFQLLAYASHPDRADDGRREHLSEAGLPVRRAEESTRRTPSVPSGSTVSTTSEPAARVYLSWGLGIVSASGLLVSVLAMVFSLRAFGSRHGTGTLSGALVSGEHRKGRLADAWSYVQNCFGILVGKEICPPGSPVEDAALAREGSETHSRRLAHLAFFQKQYGSFDPSLIQNQRLLDMRALNYAKIYPEVHARHMLLAGLVMAVVCGVLTFVVAVL